MALYVVGDVHGFHAQVTAALADAGLVSESGRWAGGTDKLWFLGDLTDRGPDGVAVIDLVRRLQAEAAEAGGEVGCVLGNHDMLLYGSKFVPDSPVNEFRSIIQVWALNGGKDTDLSGLDDERAAFLASLPAVALVDGHLLLHADTMSYLEFGATIDEINTTMATVMRERDVETFGHRTRLLFHRFEFLDRPGESTGEENARKLLDQLGGEQIVHGHSTIPETFRISPSAVVGPQVYAGGLAMAADTGIALGAPCIAIKVTD
jgi:hypothetical protein